MKNLNNLLNENLAVESDDNLIAESVDNYSSNEYNLPIAAIINNQSGDLGCLIGGTFTVKDTYKRKKAENLIKQLGYKIEISFEDYVESAGGLNKLSSFTNFAYVVINGEKSAYAVALGDDDIYIIYK